MSTDPGPISQPPIQNLQPTRPKLSNVTLSEDERERLIASIDRQLDEIDRRAAEGESAPERSAFRTRQRKKS